MELWTASLYMNRNFTKPVIYANPKFQNPYFLFFGLNGLTRAGVDTDKKETFASIYG